VVRITFDPMSLATTEYYCNGSFARMAGLTVGRARPCRPLRTSFSPHDARACFSPPHSPCSEANLPSAERGARLAGGGQRPAAAALPARRDAADAGLHPRLVRAGEHALLPVALARSARRDRPCAGLAAPSPDPISAGKAPALVRCTITKVLDDRGRCWQVDATQPL
jgi:hypothetical protein